MNSKPTPESAKNHSKDIEEVFVSAFDMIDKFNEILHETWKTFRIIDESTVKDFGNSLGQFESTLDKIKEDINQELVIHRSMCDECELLIQYHQARLTAKASASGNETDAVGKDEKAPGNKTCDAA